MHFCVGNDVSEKKDSIQSEIEVWLIKDRANLLLAFSSAVSLLQQVAEKFQFEQVLKNLSHAADIWL